MHSQNTYQAIVWGEHRALLYRIQKCPQGLWRLWVEEYGENGREQAVRVCVPGGEKTGHWLHKLIENGVYPEHIPAILQDMGMSCSIRRKRCGIDRRVKKE